MTANILICVILTATGSVYNKEFDRAADAYETGHYAGAIDAYEQLVGESVVHAALFYNLGNAYYRSGRLGAAVANYERALELDPRFDNARENLNKAVADSKQRLAKPLPSDLEQSLFFWHYLTPRAATNRLALLFWIAFWVVMGVRQARPLRYTRPLAALLALLAVAFAGSAWVKANAPALAVADADPARVMYGMSENGAVRFELHPGDRVVVDQRRNGWSRVKTATGDRGWTRDVNLAFVGPPYERPARHDSAKTESDDEGKT